MAMVVRVASTTKAPRTPANCSMRTRRRRAERRRRVRARLREGSANGVTKVELLRGVSGNECEDGVKPPRHSVERRSDLGQTDLPAEREPAEQVGRQHQR